MPERLVLIMNKYKLQGRSVQEISVVVQDKINRVKEKLVKLAEKRHHH